MSKLDNVLVSLSKALHDGGINHAEAKREIKALVIQIIGHNEDIRDAITADKDGWDAHIRNELRDAQRQKMWKLLQ